MENIYSSELEHHGIRGMRWGVRRYQNKDGTLTDRGKKRYNKEVEKLKAEEAKIAKAEKIAANRRRTQGKIDKLTAKEQELEARKKALKGKKDIDDVVEETLEERRAKALKTTDPAELYKNKDLLTTQELNERVNRIDLEYRLQGKIPAEPKQKTGMDYVDAAANNIGKVTNLYKKVDDAVTTVSKSTIGQTLAKKLGIELEESKDYRKMLDNLDDIKDPDEMAKVSRFATQRKIAEEANNNYKTKKAEAKAAKEAEKAAKEAKEKAQKAVDEYNERWQKGEIKNDGTYAKKGKDIVDNITSTRDKQLPAVTKTEKPAYIKREKVGDEYRYWYKDDMMSNATRSSAYSAGKKYIEDSSSKLKKTRVNRDDDNIIDVDFEEID